MKRIVMLAMIGLMAVVLGACGQSTPPKPETNASEVAADQTQDNQAQDNQTQEQSQDQTQDQQQPAPATSEEAPAADTNAAQ